jgi:hypothetical protein
VKLSLQSLPALARESKSTIVTPRPTSCWVAPSLSPFSVTRGPLGSVTLKAPPSSFQKLPTTCPESGTFEPCSSKKERRVRQQPMTGEGRLELGRVSLYCLYSCILQHPPPDVHDLLMHPIDALQLVKCAVQPTDTPSNLCSGNRVPKTSLPSQDELHSDREGWPDRSNARYKPRLKHINPET